MMEELYLAMESLKENLTEVTEQQRDMIYEQFNVFISTQFIYGKYEEEGLIIFGMPTEAFKSFDYYTGLEYHKDYIKMEFTLEGFTIRGYNESSRADRLYELFEPEEEL